MGSYGINGNMDRGKRVGEGERQVTRLRVISGGYNGR